MEMKHSDKPLRLFIAVRLPEFIKSRLKEWRQSQEQEPHFRKWTHPDDYHITVQFLGDTNPQQIPAIYGALSQAASQIHPFSLEFGAMGTFGLPESPRVLWAGVIDDSKGLNQLYDVVTQAMGELGFAKESRPYHPHITIARKYAEKAPFSMDKLSPVMTQSSLPEMAQNALKWEVNEFVLFSTHLHESPMYEILKAFRLEES